MRYKIGTGIWLHNPQQKKGRSPKLGRNWGGPYVVVKQINDVVIRIKRSRQAKPKVVHMAVTQAENLLIGLWIKEALMKDL